ncbi:MAG: FHA domain-containing protein [Lachnospiraceae bacterium]|nr:FHA domain-containing protein [Lachnospiraceae bacterium]
MAIIRCGKGHYYDDSKFSQCPHCGIFLDGEDDKTVAMAEPSGDDFNKTLAITAGKTDGRQPAAFVRPTVDEDDKTISLYAETKGEDFIVGWLVCIEGPEKGRDYRLHQGFNRVGRGYNMDVAMVEDSGISREPEFAVVYDEKGNSFYAVQQPAGNAYLNGTTLEGAVPLKTGDVMKTGNTQFEFIAFCREGRVW